MDSTDTPAAGDVWASPQSTRTDYPGAEAPRQPARFPAAAKVAAPVIAAFLVGGGAVYALEHHSGSSGGTNAAAAGVPNGPGGSSSGFGGGGVSGEQHIQGTVTAKTGSSVTVRSSSGSATYTVNVTTEIVRNGRSATLADVKVGDPVLAHVYPSSSGQMLVECLFAGTSASDSGPGGFAPPPGSSGSNPQITPNST
jgi:hypothetical protein